MKGIITKTVGGFFFVADSQKQIHKTRIRGRIQKQVYPGDRVEFSPGDMIIESVYERENLLYRPRVANTDQVLLIQSFQKPGLDWTLLDRFLVVIQASGLPPVLVVNKLDLAGDDGCLRQLEDYREAGFDVICVSASSGENTDRLASLMQGKINVMAGPSGVGKTSLINEITGADLPVGSLSKKLQRGVHTTRHVELLPLDGKQGEGWIADTPGFTVLDIDQIPPEELRYFYPEFDRYMEYCKFNGCSHTHEPGCAVKQAVDRGEIPEIRYNSYCQFYRELTE